jgi:hypothetical protein
MARMTKLSYECFDWMRKNYKPGTSRHQLSKDQEKKIIVTTSTFQKYKDVSKPFCAWCKEKGLTGDFGRSDVTKDLIATYLMQKENEGCSAATISTYMSALNKIFQTDISKKEYGLKKRSYQDITRSRNNTNEKLSQGILKANEKPIMLGRAFGLRRSELMVVRKEQFLRDRHGNIIKVDMEGWQCKNGRPRVVNIDTKYQDQFTAMIDNLEKDSTDRVVDSYNTRIDNHSYRREYAQSKYQEYLEKKGFEEKTYLQNYDPELLKKVTLDLGHERISVIVYNYLI